MKCERCDKEHDGTFGSGRFCSQSCASSRTWSSKDREKKSRSAKTSSKVLEANRNQETRYHAPRETRECPICGKKFTFKKSEPKKFCSQKCYLTIAGGFKEGSVKNHKHGTYQGCYYDSSWELIWIKWAIDSGIRFERNSEGFPYIFRGRSHRYYPDFYLPDEDKYVEVKGILDEQWVAKREAFPHQLEVITEVDIKTLSKQIDGK